MAGDGKERVNASMPGPWIVSVGIDIGTSTTKMIVSRLKLMRTSSSISLPRYDIVERELLYESPIYGTPLRSGDEVDAGEISAILAKEYRSAGIRPGDLKSGAVIITGETANKKNAQQILHLLAERSGDFVVATAGADLEGLLAGRGAGAEERSRQTKGAVANLDIGGGTANTAIFRRGRPVGTVTFHVGGRLIRLDACGRIAAVSPSLRPWLALNGYRLETGQTASFELIKEICASMSRDMLDYLSGRATPGDRPALNELILGSPLRSMPPIEEWMVSGGVGMLMQEAGPDSLAEAARFSDIGPLLAKTLKEASSLYPARLVPPLQTVRATVIGAGTQSTEISGATVHLDETVLPLRNLPVWKLELKQAQLDAPVQLEQAIAESIRTASDLFDRDASPPFALALSGGLHYGYTALQRMSEFLVNGFREAFPYSGVMVVVCESDIAKALGLSLSRRCGGRPKIVCIDQVKVEYGDYIDLGEPISEIMIPVVVKTLAFHNSAVGGTHA